MSVLLQQVSANPDPTGMPAQSFIQQLLDWLMVLALWGSLASLLLGAGLWGISQLGSSPQGNTRGKSLVIGGGIGAIVAGLAPTIVNELYAASQRT